MNCEYCKADCAHRGEQREKECKGYIPMTTADRIRAMNDEELADWLARVQIDNVVSALKIAGIHWEEHIRFIFWSLLYIHHNCMR